jgi:hypothetical protein
MASAQTYSEAAVLRIYTHAVFKDMTLAFFIKEPHRKKLFIIFWAHHVC